jgi:hypothetical protein
LAAEAGAFCCQPRTTNHSFTTGCTTVPSGSWVDHDRGARLHAGHHLDLGPVIAAELHLVVADAVVAVQHAELHRLLLFAVGGVRLRLQVVFGDGAFKGRGHAANGRAEAPGRPPAVDLLNPCVTFGEKRLTGERTDGI